MTTNASSLVVLKNGLSVTSDALRLAWDLEDRELVLRVEDPDDLLVGPRDRLTPDDRQLITQHKDELIRLVRYCKEVVA